jgi:mRNA interferase MazF
VVKRREVWWYEDPRAGRRPFLILTREAAIPVIAVPATRTIGGIPTEVPLGTDDGMPAECVLTLDNLRVIRPALCTQRLAGIGPERLAEVCAALRIAVDC